VNFNILAKNSNSSEHGNELSDSRQGGESFWPLKAYRNFKNFLPCRYLKDI
jgi:hypothetical protein